MSHLVVTLLEEGNDWIDGPYVRFSVSCNEHQRIDRNLYLNGYVCKRCEKHIRLNELTFAFPEDKYKVAFWRMSSL
jgi:hypothetical protein